MVLFSLPAGAGGDASYDNGDIETQLLLYVSSDFDLVESRHAIPLEVLVEDIHGIPHAGVPVRVTASAGRVLPERAMTDAAGQAAFTFLADFPGDRAVRITARIELPGAASGIDAFEVRVVALPPPPIYAHAEFLSAGLLSTLLAFFWSESGRTPLAGVLFPLYTRLKREQVLDHFVRGQIFGAVRTRPGISYAELRRLLGLSNGSLSYHVRMLEVQGFVRSEREGVHRRFFAGDVPSVEDEGARLSELQRRLLARLRTNPAATQRALAEEAGVTQQCVSYNLLFLRRQGSVDRVVEGGRLMYRVTEG